VAGYDLTSVTLQVGWYFDGPESRDADRFLWKLGESSLKSEKGNLAAEISMYDFNSFYCYRLILLFYNV